MKFPLLNLMNKSLAARTLVFLVCVSALAISGSAQKKSLQTTWEKLVAPEAIGVDIEHCANGPLSAPIPCNTSGANEGYGRGNLVPSKSHYLEGDSVPIRIVATDLVIGQQYTVTIGYDYTKSGKYATDYLTRYDRTESVNNNPCVDVLGCSLATEQTIAVPLDPDVAEGFDQMLGTADDITQIPGQFSCFGCTWVATSGYTLSGSTAGDSTKSLTLTFEADAETVVISYGSHISTRSDWGVNNSAINISGSPYHNFIVSFPGSNQGNRDLQLAAEAVIFPARVTIIKTVTTLGTPPGTSSTFQFNFTSTANLGTTGFTLVDNVDGAGGGSQLFTPLTAFGAANSITVTEANYAPNWTLSSITCVEDPGGLPQLDNSTTNLGGRSATIILEEGEFVTCTFHNTQLVPTAAPASVSGRVVNSFGGGIYGARVAMTDVQSGEVWVALTNMFGYYTIEGPEVGNFYMLNVNHKRFTFADDTRMFTLNEDLVGMDFVANP
jgi:hypothetical protein